LIASGIASGLPDVYRSGSEMQINLEGPALNTVDTIQLTRFADQYVGNLQRKVISPQNLLTWAKDIGVYPELEKATDSELIREMSNNVRVSLVTTGVLETNSGRELELITGFTASFDHADPVTAQQVAEKLAEAFLSEDRQIGLEKTAPVLSFLEQQMKAKLAEITDLEAKIATFKEENAGRLPEMMALNMTQLDRHERDLDAVNNEIRNLEEDRIYRQRQLDEIVSEASATEQLATLQQQYVEMLSKYGSDHPDLIRTKRQIDALTGRTLDGETAEIAKLQTELAELRQRYSDEHPDVKRVQRQIDELRADQKNTMGEMAGPSNDPRYLAAKADINAIDVRLASLRSQQRELRSKIVEVEGKISRMPQVERQFMALQRDLDSARQAYNKLRENADETRGIMDVEKELGARLIQVRQALVPDEPASPPRLAIFVLGVFLAATFGGIAAVAAEALDSTIRGSRDIQSILHTKPLVTIPVIQNSVVRAEKRKHLALVTISFIVLVAIVLSMSGLVRLTDLF
jgi:uncharacterized protein involved in exopolysaccharide biosynthesis